MDCCICYDIINDQEKEILNCNHIFHEKCIEKWFQRGHQCPLCRKSKFDISLKGYEIHYWKKSNEIIHQIKQCSNPLFKFCPHKDNIKHELSGTSVTTVNFAWFNQDPEEGEHYL
tara:strand:+ start:125 stop:469 length:345 start_codon:yes stop_codon:yes gene_type:complete